MAGGWQGLYLITDGGDTMTKLDVNYAKCVGYGAPEKDGDPNTLFIYGKIAADDVEGIYRSQDAGKSWVLINTQHLYGGTGNGNYIVGDLNEFGKMYMSTVGCGIVWGGISGSEPPATTESTESEEPSGVKYGDVNEDGTVNIADVIVLNKCLLGDVTAVTDQGMRNADVDDNDMVESTDSLNILKFCVGLLKDFPVK